MFRAKRRDGTGDAIALKRILAGAAHDRETQRVLLAEAELVAKLDHPGLLKAGEHGVVSGVAFATYDLVRGHDLETVTAALRAKGDRMPRGVAISITQRVIEIATPRGILSPRPRRAAATVSRSCPRPRS